MASGSYKCGGVVLKMEGVDQTHPHTHTHTTHPYHHILVPVGCSGMDDDYREIPHWGFPIATEDICPCTKKK